MVVAGFIAGCAESSALDESLVIVYKYNESPVELANEP